ncbi:MAG: hypothetical protein L6R40_000085 [Gallowayella cf. fulva]|nr:MAG: hypothetical protein L6R40_000085 [Xanthomendoza cf. fulva]
MADHHRRHILKDIDPYVCLFEGCNRPTEQYQSFDEWITHMQWQHTLVWSCQAPRHTHVRFDTSGDCEAHMRQEHSEDISTEQLILLVEKSAHPAADPFEALIRYDEVNSEARSVCPLCPWAVKSDRIPEPTNLESVSAESGDGMKQMRDHIAAHLESIALLSLPEQENIENAASDEVQSESAKVSSRGADPYEEPLLDTSEAWRSHNEVRWNSESFVEQTDYARDVIPLLVEDEDWTFVTSRIRARSVPLDPGQDPVLVPFVEQARRVQTLELQRRLGIPLIVISDPSGLEVPEAKWSNQPEQLQAHTANVAELHNIGPSSPLADQRKRRIRENRSESVSALENTPSAVTQVTQGIPKIVLIEDSE